MNTLKRLLSATAVDNVSGMQSAKTLKLASDDELTVGLVDFIDLILWRTICRPSIFTTDGLY